MRMEERNTSGRRIALMKSFGLRTTKYRLPWSFELHLLSLSIQVYYGFSSLIVVVLLNQIMEFGSQSFAQHVIELKDAFEKKEALTLVTSQFLGYQSFAEKLNLLMVNIFKIMKVRAIEELMISVSKTMKPIFAAENVHLWMTDAVSLH
jgi:hypothetical protein